MKVKMLAACLCLFLAMGAGSLPGCEDKEEPGRGEALTEESGKKEKKEPEKLKDQGKDSYEDQREAMVRTQIQARGIRDPAVLNAMREVKRHEFVPAYQRSNAYRDHPLPIGHGQTISQPYIVAYMTEALDLEPGEKVLEIGTGSGYQAAVLAKITDQVYTIEIICGLEKRAKQTLKRLGYNEVQTRCADGYKGWPDHAPFDAVIVTAAPDHVPGPLVEQLAEGGRLVIPVGEHFQELVRITKTKEGTKKERLLPVRFVPMTGEAQEK